MIKRLSPREFARTLPTIKVERLSRGEFSLALKRGQGRALLHVAEYGDKGIEKELKKSLLKDNALYGVQYRVNWILTLIELSGRTKVYAKYLMDNFCQPSATPSDIEYQYRLAHNFFEYGIFGFRGMMFKKFERIVVSRFMADCAAALLEVSGQAGLEHVAKLCGARADYINKRQCSEVLDGAIELGCEMTIMETMNAKSERYPEVKAFMEICADYKKKSERPYRSERKRIEVEDLASLVEEGIAEKVPFKFFMFGLIASDEELSQVRTKLLAAKTNTERAAWLEVYSFKGVPEDSAEFFKFLKSRNVAVQRAAADAFSRTESPEVRDTALKLLSSGKKSELLSALSLMESNYRKCDADLINRAVLLMSKENEVHIANSSLKQIISNEGGPELLFSVVHLYERLSCTLCRFDLLELLVEWDACPMRYLWEAQWDGDLDIQNYARGVVANLEVDDLRECV